MDNTRMMEFVGPAVGHPDGGDAVQYCPVGQGVGIGSSMKFAQIIEFSTDRIDEFNAELDAWQVRTEGDRVPHRAVLSRDHGVQGRYLLMVEFASREQANANSSRPETAAFASFMAAISTSPLTFRNLDILREEAF